MLERWRPVPLDDYRDFYEVSDFGNVRMRIRRHRWDKGHVLRGGRDRHGYHRYHLSNADGSKRESFTAEYLCKLAHGKKPIEMTPERVIPTDSGLTIVIPPKPKRPIRRGQDASGAKLTPEQVAEIRELAEQGMSQRKIARLYNVTHVTIGNIIRGETW